ncbi:MAG: ComF family protein [Chloroflexota bacterium]|nr:MAG: ComF family protein [Chloroflexota bacterium]
MKSISGCLAMLMADYLQENPMHGGALVPVPLHYRRLRERGYNQSNLLAQELGKLIVLPVIDDSLRRLRDSLPQARTTTISERRKNVEEAFSCQGEELKAKNVILIDDVCTSGATLEACAVALKAGGAISVWGLTLAREI